MITEINQSGLMIDLTFRVSFAMFILLYTMVSSAALISLDSSVFFAVIFHLERLAVCISRLCFLWFLDRLSVRVLLVDTSFGNLCLCIILCRKAKRYIKHDSTLALS